MVVSFPQDRYILGTQLIFVGPETAPHLKVKKQLPPYLVPHVHHFLGVGIERHKLVWVFDPYWHATAGFIHLVSLHPLNTHKARWVRQRNNVTMSFPMAHP